MEALYKFLNDLPILPKLVFVPAAPLFFLILFGAMSYMEVLTSFLDEERLTESYVEQKTAGHYMRAVADLESTFLGYVISKDEEYLQGFEQGQAILLALEQERASKIPPEENHMFTTLREAVTKSVANKEKFIQALKSGSSTEAVRYVQDGKSREIMVEIRNWMKEIDQMGRDSTQQELSRISYDQTKTRFIMVSTGMLVLASLFLGSQPSLNQS